ncbi:Periplasmic beta-glucosidase [Sphaceloma murrayae]|uniref:beta-glucosidase n=1 Tax=Sphaceloma murrayae TaxID=2082308 RepID=A0A2K1QRG0_9PEZI|nr:Periplasmic beta-glucosidase [Sphaceloma murrayae]
MLHTLTNEGPASNPVSIAGAEPFSFTNAISAVESGQPLDATIERLLQELTKAERLSLLDGDVPFWSGLRTILCDRYNREPFVHGCIERLAIPGIRFTDGPRGVVMGSSTAFPVSSSRGATWDVELEERIGDVIGLEGRAQGANYFAGICINLPRHPAWGRIQETYGEDPLLLGEFGLALHRGCQRHLMTCVKHYALNSMENARFRVDVEVDDASLHEVYLPHFKRLVEGGVDSIMSSYNSVRGEFAGQNKELLIEILRNQWKFDGFVLSDFIFGLRDAALSLEHGLDVEAPFSQQRATYLQASTLDWSAVDRACTRILRKQIQYTVRSGTTKPSPSVVYSKSHRHLAREAAAKGMVLLKNEPVQGMPTLPVPRQGTNRIAIVGRLANTPNTGDRGSSAVFSPHVVTAYEGLKAAFPDAKVMLEDTDSAERAREIASDVDLVVALVGYDARDEGEYVVPSFKEDPELLNLFPPARTPEERETLALVQGENVSATVENQQEQALVPGMGGDRRSLRLRQRDVEIISAVAMSTSNIIVSIVAAGAVIMEEWIDKVPAVLMSWYSGCEGGHALADVLLGQQDASGRLPFSIPTSEAHLPHFDIDTTKITYDRWFGQRLLDKLHIPARFPLGYGLSYTTFVFDHLSADSSPVWRDGLETIIVQAHVTNTGDRVGRHVAQVYGVSGADGFPSRVLLGFQSIDLDAGQCKEIRIAASIRPLQRWTPSGFIVQSKLVGIELAAFSGDPKALKTFVSL